MKKDEMKKDAIRFEVEGVLEDVLPDIMFYLGDEYTKEESQAYAAIFKEVFNDMIDSVLKERKEKGE